MGSVSFARYSDSGARQCGRPSSQLDFRNNRTQARVGPLVLKEAQ